MKPNVGYTSPELLDKLEEYQAIRDAMAGETAVKGGHCHRYLPETDPFMNDVIRRAAIYEQYKMRPPWYGVPKRTRNALKGEAFRRPPEIVLPAGLKLLEEDVDGNGMTLLQQMDKSVSENIDIGRGGLLTDYTDKSELGKNVVTKADTASGNVRPTIVRYDAESIVNWNVTRIGSRTIPSQVILEETYVAEDDGYERKLGRQRKELNLEVFEGGTFVTCTIWRQAKNKKTNEDEWVAVKKDTPIIDYSGKGIEEIPFFPFGSEDNNFTIDPSMMSDIVYLTYAHFRVSADLYATAFKSAHAQLVMKGAGDLKEELDAGLRIGPNTALVSRNPEFDVKYISAPAVTLNVTLLEGIEKQQGALAAKLIREALTRKTAAQAKREEAAETSTLTKVVNNVSRAYTLALRAAARFTGDNPDEVVCNLNTQFTLTEADSQEVLALVTAKESGAISLKEVRKLLAEKGIATETYDEYLESIRTQPNVGTANAAGGGAEQRVATEL